MKLLPCIPVASSGCPLLPALLAIVLSVNLQPARAADPISLFDGKTLDGWEADLQYWSVKDGAIVGEIPAGQTLRKNTWLVWQGGDVSDFDLRLQVKLTGAAAANSGIQFRCQVQDVDHVSGYQADLDMGAVWLGRIYDEHGRALLVERGSRVEITEDGTRRSEIFAPADQYAVLFREDAWNDYRIVAQGEQIAVYVNGTLFSELIDRQTGERDLQGQLAFQLHSGPETRVSFRDIRLQPLSDQDRLLKPFSLKQQPEAANSPEAGSAPETDDGAALNLGFESGTLADWQATGDAFRDQPVRQDGIAARWQGQTSNKQGQFFIGGYEVVGDQGVGTLTSVAFRVTQPYASFLIGGGDTQQTRVELVLADSDSETVIFAATGDRREQMRRVVADLQEYRGQQIRVRVVDDSQGPWGHLNFDDFRFHEQAPEPPQSTNTAWRTIQNPLLQHLVPNPVATDDRVRGHDTLQQMYVPDGFSVDLIAAEPDLHQPMAFTFDARGRLWVVEGYSYPQKRPAGEGLDRILIFADQDNDGSFESRKVFIEGLNLVSGMEVGYGGVWVGAAPELLFIPDRDADDTPDRQPIVVLDGFGYADTHETLNSFLWGPDGWLYGNQGVFNRSVIGRPGAPDSQRTAMQAGVWRYHPTRQQFEVFASGGSNQWGLDYDQFGQMFMTHCRSHWGQGLTTHVMQGGHYWNQVNSGYAPFISSTPLPDRPWLRNYLLASARYGHGEGGAGRPGSRQVYGGHSHVGTMIYLGDNWPAEYRNHLFTHNLHGHQLNHQQNVRLAGGYDTQHAGYDVLFCADPQYIGVDLQYGPDGAVYISDWYDPRHCHNPNVEHWDRGNGRMYRLKFDETWTPAGVDYTVASDDELVDALLHDNDWHVRTALRLLSERAVQQPVAATAVQRLIGMATEHPQPTRRLRAVWALHSIGALNPQLAVELLNDDSEYVRGWTVQLCVEALDVPHLLQQLAERETSLLVKRYLASAVQRLPADAAWHIVETLSAQPQNATDRDLPLLLWYGLAGLMEQDLSRAFELAQRTQIPGLRDYVPWYAARLSATGRQLVARRLVQAEPAEQRRLLSLFELAVRGMRGLDVPDGWETVAAGLYEATDGRIRQSAESVGAAFGDTRLFQRMRGVLADESADVRTRRHALSILAGDSSAANLLVFLQLLDHPQLAPQVIPLLGRYNSPEVAQALLQRLPHWDGETANAALEVLSGRVAWSERLLDAVASGSLEKSRLTSYVVRQMASLGDQQLSERLSREWGRLGQTSAEVQHEIAETVETYQSAPLWAYSAEAGAAHFKQLCAACHQPDQQDQTLGPRLAGTGSKGIEYIVENVLDPNAVIGRDFQAQVIVTTDGRVISGLILQESDTAVTLRTANSTDVIAKADIEERFVSENSFMPVGLLKPLNERERIELFKYLMTQ